MRASLARFCLFVLIAIGDSLWFFDLARYRRLWVTKTIGWYDKQRKDQKVRAGHIIKIIGQHQFHIACLWYFSEHDCLISRCVPDPKEARRFRIQCKDLRRLVGAELRIVRNDALACATSACGPIVYGKPTGTVPRHLYVPS